MLINLAIQKQDEMIQDLNELGGADNIDEYITVLETLDGHIRNRLDEAYLLQATYKNEKCKSCVVGTHYTRVENSRICTTCNSNFEGQ